MIVLTVKNMESISKKLGMFIRNGKHVNARLEVPGQFVIATCWSHGKKDIPKGTASKILKRQLMIDTPQQAEALRDCYMTKNEYLEHINKKMKS